MEQNQQSDKKQRIYLFSGLGADERAFQALDFSDYDPALVEWIPPLENETMADYALRICDQVREQNPILIGISFGGMVAVEVAKHIKTQKVILIASAKTRNEVPVYYRFVGKLNLLRIVPTAWIKHPNFLVYWLFGARSKAEKTLWDTILSDTDPVFLKWALTQIAIWNNDVVPNDLVHIHGTGDHILPFRKIRNAIPVESGGHFMMISKAEEVSAILARLLRNPS